MSDKPSNYSKTLLNVGLFGHHGAGKTQLAEAILYTSGATTRLGLVDQKSSSLDSDPEEQKRHMTLSSSAYHFEWQRRAINIVDTPGESNFFPDARNSMQAVDTAVVVVDAVDGFKINGEKAFFLAKQLNKSIGLIINRTEHERANFSALLGELAGFAGELGISIVPISTPIKVEGAKQAVFDLVAMQAFSFDEQGKRQAIDWQVTDAEEKLRTQLVETIAESSDELTEKYLETGNLSSEEIAQGLHQGVVSGTLVPLFATSAIENIGVSLFLDYAISLFPAPYEKSELCFSDSDEREQASVDGEFYGLVFKTIVDAYAGHLSLVRIMSGRLDQGADVFNSGRQEKERAGSLLRLHGNKHEPVNVAEFGDIVAIPKLKHTKTGDTLCGSKGSKRLAFLPPTPSVIAYVMEPKTKGEEDKVGQALHKLQEEDPTLSIGRDEQTKDLLVTGMGQMHIEVIVDRLKNKFNLDVELHTPRVPYRETIKGTAKVQGKYKKQTGGRGQYGDTWIEIRPIARGQGFEFVNKIVGGAIPRQYIPAVEKGIVEAMQQGAVAGFPVVDVQVTLYDGSYHTVDSSEMAFKVAGSMGFKKGVLEARPTILEPVMVMEIVVPEDSTGDVIGDINSRRGRVLGMNQKGHAHVVKAQVPMSEVLTYAPELKSMTSGRGSFTMEFDHYEELPAHLMSKVVQVSKNAQNRE